MNKDADSARNLNISTDCAHAGEEQLDSASTPSVMPIYQTSVYNFEDLEAIDDVSDGRRPGFIYGRYGLPNHVALETIAAKLEKADGAIALASGMGSIAGALWTLLAAGDELVVANDSYGGTLSLAARDFPRLGIATRFVSTTNLSSIDAALTGKTKVLAVETLSNPLWNVIDVAAVAELCHRKGVKLLVDNTVATPYLICPLTLGADVVVQSATKFLAGHHDVTAGLLFGDKEFISRAREVAIRTGAFLAPLDAWLTVRGIKTFALRMERICANALRVATFLENHPKIRRVYYPGLQSHIQNDIVRRTMKGLGGGMMSFEVDGDGKAVNDFIKGLRLIRLVPSLGGVTTTLSHPAKTSHRSLTPEQRRAVGISDTLLRLSVGIEGPDDIVDELERALKF
jgi:cystathionine beta-lyase/cystathionine gamma-synthase